MSFGNLRVLMNEVRLQTDSEEILAERVKTL